MGAQSARASHGFVHRDPVLDDVAGLAPVKAIDALVGSRLRTRRTQLALSQAALARHLGLTFSQVQKYEKGSNRISAGRLYQLAALLGVPVQYFYKGVGDPLPKPPGVSPAVTAEEEAQLHDALDKVSDPRARQALLALASSLEGKN
jgi:transcriptional regulator with XRE-family HTH domain